MRLVQNNNIYKFRAFELRSCDRHIVYMANRFLSPRLLHRQSLMILTDEDRILKKSNIRATRPVARFSRIRVHASKKNVHAWQ